MYQEDTSRQAALIFHRAAVYIRTYGWCVSGMGKHGLPRCSMGALASVHPSRKWDKKLAEFMYNKLYEELGGITLTEFNHKHQNGEKVAELFEKVAEASSPQYATVSCN